MILSGLPQEQNNNKTNKNSCNDDDDDDIKNDNNEEEEMEDDTHKRTRTHARKRTNASIGRTYNTAHILIRCDHVVLILTEARCLPLSESEASEMPT